MSVGIGFGKHRDFAHSNFLSHLLDNGGAYKVDLDAVWCDIDPLTGFATESTKYYFVDVSISDNSYIYLIRANRQELAPSAEEIAEAMTAYSKNPLPGGRDWMDYIDLDNENNYQNSRVVARLVDDGLSVNDIDNRAQPQQVGPAEKKKFSIEDYA